MKLNTHLSLVPNLRMSVAISLLLGIRRDHFTLLYFTLLYF